MKSVMGFGFFLLFMAGIALVMLQGREMAKQNLPGGGSGMAGIEWRPVLIDDEPVAADSEAFVKFTVDGSVTGNSGCNNFSGAMEMAEDGIKMGQLASTRKACPPEIMAVEDRFLQALQDTARFEMANDSLRLLNAEGDALAEFAAAESAAE